MISFQHPNLSSEGKMKSLQACFAQSGHWCVGILEAS